MKHKAEMPMGKVVRYNGETKDYAMYLDRQYLGSRAKQHDAEKALNEHVHNLLTHNGMRKAA